MGLVSPGVTSAATGTLLTFQWNWLCPPVGLTWNGIAFMSPQAESGPTGLKARALTVGLPRPLKRITPVLREAGTFACRSTQLAVWAAAPSGSTTSTEVPGASKRLRTLTVTVAHSPKLGACGHLQFDRDRRAGRGGKDRRG